MVVLKYSFFRFLIIVNVINRDDPTVQWLKNNAPAQTCDKMMDTDKSCHRKSKGKIKTINFGGNLQNAVKQIFNIKTIKQ